MRMDCYTRCMKCQYKCNRREVAWGIVFDEAISKL